MGTPLRVLIVEDSANDAEIILRELERGGYAVTHERVETAGTLHAALGSSPWDVVLSDHSLPQLSAPDALAIVKHAGLDLPFIVVSGTVGEETAVGDLKAGAHDFVIKGRLARLVPVIQREMRDKIGRQERRRAEEALRESEEQYRSLVDFAVFGIFQATSDGRFLTVNPALVTMLGYDSADALLALTLPDVYADPSVHAGLVNRGARATFAGIETIWWRRGGGEIRVRLSGRLTDPRSAHGPALEVIVEDVTDQHGLQEQLRQAQKMEAIGQMAGGIAHDFNNMLTAILGYSELLTEQIGPDKPIGRDLREIRSAAERAAALTRQLLAFSRKQILMIIPVNLTDIVGNLQPMLRRLLGAPIRIRTNLAIDLRPVMADVTQLEHLLINLSVNARDAMPQGGVLTIATRNADLDADFARNHPGAAAGSYAVMSVSDTGIGMTSEVQTRIFEPFFTTKEPGRGTGLGLAAVYGTVKQLGGYIGVESQPGRGSTFEVYLPETEQAVKVEDDLLPIASPVGAETILLVEDETGVRAFTRTALQRFGYRVVEADSAEAALKLLREHGSPLHLLLTDVVLPGMDGRELAVRVIQDRPGIRVLLMSGYASELHTPDGFPRPGMQFLQKPFTAQVLLSKTRELLGTEIGPAGPAGPAGPSNLHR